MAQCEKCRGNHKTEDHWRHKESGNIDQLLGQVGPVGYERDADDPNHPDYEYNDPAWCYECNKDTAFCTCNGPLDWEE